MIIRDKNGSKLNVGDLVWVNDPYSQNNQKTYLAKVLEIDIDHLIESLPKMYYVTIYSPFNAQVRRFVGRRIDELERIPKYRRIREQKLMVLKLEGHVPFEFYFS